MQTGGKQVSGLFSIRQEGGAMNLQTAKRADGILSCIRQSMASSSRGDPSPLLSPGEAAPGVLGPVVNTPSTREAWTYWREPNISHEDTEVTGAPLLCEGLTEHGSLEILDTEIVDGIII